MSTYDKSLTMNIIFGIFWSLNHESMKWLHSLTKRFDFHPAVIRAIHESLTALGIDYVDIPQDYVERLKTVLMEWPHISTEDNRMVAYTRNASYGESDRRVKGKLGGYVTKHFPEIPGHIVEMIVDSYRSQGCKYKLLDNIEDIVNTMYNCKANSCMTNSRFKHQYHPYRVYSPELGWSLAVKVDTDGIVSSRALVHFSEDFKTFVRIYTHNGNEIRPDDPGLRGWLLEQNYRKIDGWKGYEIAELYNDHDKLIGPYIDGDYVCGSFKNGTITLNSDGEIRFQRTDGLADYDDHDGMIETYDGLWIDIDYSVELHNGDIVHRDNAYYVEREDQYYVYGEVRELAEGGYGLRSECIYIVTDNYQGYYHKDECALCLVDDMVKWFVSIDPDINGRELKLRSYGENESPQIGDRVMLSQSGMDNYGTCNNPRYTMGTISIIDSRDYIRVDWDNECSNSYCGKRDFDIYMTIDEINSKMAECEVEHES